MNVAALFAQILDRHIRRVPGVDARVADAMARVDRRLYVARAYVPLAYIDRPLAIGSGQTISQPSMVAIMLSAAEITPADRVLEIGTGSGYGAAILAELAAHVVSIERKPELATRAAARLRENGVMRVEVRVGDGSIGESVDGEFDAIVVTAAAPHIPQALVPHLRDGGRLLVPVGDLQRQVLTRLRRRGAQYAPERLCACAFVPLVGAAAWSRADSNCKD